MRPISLTVKLCALAALLSAGPTVSRAASMASVTSNGVTWTFLQPVESGVFVNGDPWVVGPVKVVAITNSLNATDYQAKPGQNGSMVNPGGSSKQGYDSGLASYDATLNAGLPNGEPVAPGNPLVLAQGTTLVSMVSWLWNSKEDTEPGTPAFGGGGGTPRPATRSAGILTVLAAVPPAEAFRPPYAGDDKQVKFTFADLDQSKLGKLAPVSASPDIAELEEAMKKTWVDHVATWLGALVHPSEHMPNYGREMGHIIAKTGLALQLDFEQIPQADSKRQLLINFVQFGIDCGGIADAGGGWGADGGHGLARKMPILVAGALLDDPHLLGVGQWDTRFQEDEVTFNVTQAEIDITNGSNWKPDRRVVVAPYTAAHLGMPEWGIRHLKEPNRDSAAWEARYRDINNSVHVGTALVIRLMGLTEQWNHKPFFDYTDRVMKHSKRVTNGTNAVPAFAEEMWNAYRGPETRLELKPEWL